MNNYNEVDNKPYSLVMNADSTPESGDFPNVIGYEKQKKELQLIFDWFNRSKELTQRGLNIPKGAILYGEPGNGKTLLIREIVGSTNSPVLIFNGDGTNIVDGINETFKEARTLGHAIVIFDELDLLINKERRVVRALQENMDGVESNDDILVLAATNDIDEIPDALLRDGRFGKTICIDRPTKETALAIFKKHYSDLNLQYPDDFDDEEVALSLSGLTCAALKSVVNDLALRNGFDGITLDMIEDSISNISNKERSTSKKEYFSVAVHEAGHAVVANTFQNYFSIVNVSIFGTEGMLRTREVDEDFWPYKKSIASIKISMAGCIAQKLVLGESCRGVVSDLQEARSFAYNLINASGYSSLWETLPDTTNPYSRKETQIKKRKMERKIERLLKKCEKETTRYLKRNLTKVISLAETLLAKKHLKASTIHSLID